MLNFTWTFGGGISANIMALILNLIVYITLACLSAPRASLAQSHLPHQGHPFDFGDFLAMVIVFAIVFCGIFGLLGKYARVRAGQL
jgi:large-conductance mechanosensitive channel